MSRILVVDNYDSFVYNLVQYLAEIGAEVEIWRNDDSRFFQNENSQDFSSQIFHSDWAKDFDGILLSPGPGTPADAGVCIEIVKSLAGIKPIFGVCLGLQAIAVAFGGVVDRAPELRHGKTSKIDHNQAGIFAGLPTPLTVTRYHSLALIPETTPIELEITAQTKSGIIQALRHREYEIHATQFHPESVLTEGGYQMLANWLAICGDLAAPHRAQQLRPIRPQ